MKFEDIRVGDKIRATYVITKDEYITIKETRECVVTRIEGGYLYAGETLMTLSSDLATYELLERPTSKVPTDYLSVIRHKEHPDLFVLVRVGKSGDHYPWMGSLGNRDKRRWLQNRDVKELLDTGEWEIENV